MAQNGAATTPVSSRLHVQLNENTRRALAMLAFGFELLAGSMSTLSCGGSSAAKSLTTSSSDGGTDVGARPDGATADGPAAEVVITAGDASLGERKTERPEAGSGTPGDDGGDPATVTDADADGADDAREAALAIVAGRSCVGLPRTCGPTGTEDCCASAVVPGGTFNRSNDAMFSATVSDFRLDVYEITVGRFRRFVAEYPASKPAAGSGRNPHVIADTGWDAGWPLPTDQAALIRQLKCDSASNYTWRDLPDTSENLPMNCIDWLVAYAFCIWDGGRLPTEAEWNYAAAGGSEQRYYPWSVPPSSTTIDMTMAVFGVPYSTSGTPPVARVGSRSPQGDGKWGHADLAGNLWELTRDQLDLGFTYANPCVDCISPEPVNPTTSSFPGDAIRGGGFLHSPFDLWTGKRSNIGPAIPEADIGARCARQP